MKIIILTYAPPNTLGDPSAAAKLQQLLIKKFGTHHEELDVKVLVSVSQTDEAPVRNLFQVGVKYELINGFDTATGQTQLAQAIYDCDLIITYPTPHFLSQGLANRIADTMKPTISLSEYDYDIKFQHAVRGQVEVVPGSIFLNSGISQENLGIYIENFSSRPQVHPTDSPKLPNDLMAKDKQLYFGYFNKLFNSHTGATPARFIAFAIHSSKTKEVDIVLPLQSPELPKLSEESKGSVLEKDKFIKDLEGLNQIQIAYIRPAPYPVVYLVYKRKGENLVSQEVSEEEFEDLKHKSDKIIRVINPFPLHKETIRALVEASEPVNLLTGDQSFSEALSLSKIIFYQAMGWKKNFYNALIAASEKYSVLQEWFKMVDKPSMPIASLVGFYEKNKDALIAETQALKKDFEINKNLSVIFLDYLKNFLSSSPYKRFTQFIDHMRQHPEYYFKVKKGTSGNVSILSKEAIYKHLNFYLKNASAKEKNKMLSYFNSHIDSLIKLSEYEKVWFYLDLKKQHPELDITLTAYSVIEYVRNLPRLYSEVYDRYDSPILDALSPIQSTTDSNGEEGSEPLRVTMMSLRSVLSPLALANISEFKSEEKLQILKEIIHAGAVCYSDRIPDGLFLKFLDNESEPRVLRQALKLLFTTPCYTDLDEGVKFDPNEPSLFFQMTKYRSELVEMLLNNPMAIQILSEELSIRDAPSIKASHDVKINELVLDALFFPSFTSSSSPSFFSSSPQNMIPAKEKELVCRVLFAAEKDQTTILSFFQSKFASDPGKIGNFNESFSENLPPYLKEVVNELMIPPAYK